MTSKAPTNVKALWYILKCKVNVLLDRKRNEHVAGRTVQATSG